MLNPFAASLISKLSITALLFFQIFTLDPAQAQQTVLMTATETAEAMREQGLALIYGLNGQQADVPAGAALLEQAAARGDVKAASELGRMLIDGYVVKPDPERGMMLLETAVAAGDARAMTALGGALLWGRVVPADAIRARTLLESAVAAGDAEARNLLGEQLVGGWVLPRDVAVGLPMLEAGVAVGDVGAQTALSGLYLYGIGVGKDTTRARELAEAAAAQGDAKALRQVGEMLMWSERDYAGAEALLRRAGEIGDVTAWSVLAEGAMYGYLGGGAVSRAKFDPYARLARQTGDARIEVLDATRQMWGISMRASGPQTLARLEAAALAGNAEAARFLVGLLRDGNRMNIRPQLEDAQAALTRHAAVIGADDVWRLENTIAAARARYQPEAWADLAAAVARRPDLVSPAFGRDLYKANPNAAIYLIQKKLAAEGLYHGALDGYAGRKTLRALNAACRALPDDLACDDSVMRPDILGAILASTSN